MSIAVYFLYLTFNRTEHKKQGCEISDAAEYITRVRHLREISRVHEIATASNNIYSDKQEQIEYKRQNEYCCSSFALYFDNRHKKNNDVNFYIL